MDCILEDKKAKLNATSRAWQKANKERAYAAHKKYRDKNRKSLNDRAKVYREENREEVLKRRREGTKTRKIKDPIFKLSENVRSLIGMSFKRGKIKYNKKIKTEEILGCDIEDFIQYILNKCPDGISLKDFGRYGYQLDHIIPVSLASTEEEVIKLNHYSNFQPLFWRDNIIKSNKLF